MSGKWNLDLVALRKMAGDAMESGAEMHPSQVIALLDTVEHTKKALDGATRMLDGFISCAHAYPVNAQ